MQTCIKYAYLQYKICSIKILRIKYAIFAPYSVVVLLLVHESICNSFSLVLISVSNEAQFVGSQFIVNVTGILSTVVPAYFSTEVLTDFVAYCAL